MSMAKRVAVVMRDDVQMTMPVRGVIWPVPVRGAVVVGWDVMMRLDLMVVVVMMVRFRR